jgi:hypothetical protein
MRRILLNNKAKDNANVFELLSLSYRPPIYDCLIIGIWFRQHPRLFQDDYKGFI